MVDPYPPNLFGYPSEQVEFAVAEAAVDADRVAAHLRACGIAPADGTPWSAPPGVLLDLAAVLRLRAWDAAGFTAHTEAGLPGGDRAMADLIAALVFVGRTGFKAEWGQLALRVFGVMVDRFAWSARAELRAEVVLGWPDDDSLIDALAAVLWKTRPADTAPEE